MSFKVINHVRVYVCVHACAQGLTFCIRTGELRGFVSKTPVDICNLVNQCKDSSGDKIDRTYDPDEAVESAVNGDQVKDSIYKQQVKRVVATHYQQVRYTSLNKRVGLPICMAFTHEKDVANHVSMAHILQVLQTDLATISVKVHGMTSDLHHSNVVSSVRRARVQCTRHVTPLMICVDVPSNEQSLRHINTIIAAAAAGAGSGSSSSQDDGGASDDEGLGANGLDADVAAEAEAEDRRDTEARRKEAEVRHQEEAKGRAARAGDMDLGGDSIEDDPEKAPQMWHVYYGPARYDRGSTPLAWLHANEQRENGKYFMRHAMDKDWVFIFNMDRTHVIKGKRQHSDTHTVANTAVPCDCQSALTHFPSCPPMQFSGIRCTAQGTSDAARLQPVRCSTPCSPNRATSC